MIRKLVVLEILLYDLEIKIFSNEITTNNKFKQYIYYAGEAGNIVVAAATGLVAARDILENIK